MKKAVVIAGSPRKNSSSTALACSFIKPFKGSVEIIKAYELNLSYCRGCGSCLKSGKCVIEDDGAELMDLIVQADFVIVASPVYFYGPPAALKNIVDRTQPIWVKSFLAKDPPKRKKGGLIAVGASNSENMFKAFEFIFKSWFNSINASFDLFLKFRNIENPTDINKKHMEEAAKHGETFFSQA